MFDKKYNNASKVEKDQNPNQSSRQPLPSGNNQYKKRKGFGPDSSDSSKKAKPDSISIDEEKIAMRIIGALLLKRDEQWLDLNGELLRGCNKEKTNRILALRVTKQQIMQVLSESPSEDELKASKEKIKALEGKSILFCIIYAYYKNSKLIDQLLDEEIIYIKPDPSAVVLLCKMELWGSIHKLLNQGLVTPLSILESIYSSGESYRTLEVVIDRMLSLDKPIVTAMDVFNRIIGQLKTFYQQDKVQFSLIINSDSERPDEKYIVMMQGAPLKVAQIATELERYQIATKQVLDQEKQSQNNSNKKFRKHGDIFNQY
jgi:hypothetical protein